MKIQPIQFKHAKEVKKGWGKEVIVTNIAGNLLVDGGYSGKLLVYERAGAKSSMHFHTKKDETFYVLKGIFKFYYYDPETAEMLTRTLVEGDIVDIPTHNPHQVECLQVGSIMEVATCDYAWDNYRVIAGDSQKK